MPGDNHVLLAIASECGEAWVIAGWRPATSDETAILGTLRQELGFDPCAAPERLSYKTDVPKSAKRVVMKLCANDLERERISLIDACDVPAAVPCGLRAFCDDLDAWLSTVGVTESLNPVAPPAPRRGPICLAAGRPCPAAT